MTDIQHLSIGETFYYHSDHLGSAAYLTYHGGVIQTLNYLPYGEDWVEYNFFHPDDTTRLGIYRFNGKEKDYESGFHYYGARYYWSEVLTGWLSVDALTDSFPSLSSYSYCRNNPVKLVEPDGNFPIETIWDIGNLVYDIGAAVVNHVQGNHSQAASHWVDAAMDAGAVLIPYVPAGATKAVKVANTTKKAVKPALKHSFTVKPGKYDYFFGRVNSSPHNTKRSLQNKKDLSKMGISNEQQLNRVLGDALNNGKVMNTAQRYVVK